MARWYTDVFKFSLAFGVGEIEVGILILPSMRFARLIDSNVANYQRACRELQLALIAVPIPLMIVGVEPQGEALDQLKSHYDRAMMDYPGVIPSRGRRKWSEVWQDRRELPEEIEDEVGG